MRSFLTPVHILSIWSFLNPIRPSSTGNCLAPVILCSHTGTLGLEQLINHPYFQVPYKLVPKPRMLGFPIFVASYIYHPWLIPFWIKFKTRYLSLQRPRFLNGYHCTIVLDLFSRMNMCATFQTMLTTLTIGLHFRLSIRP